MITQSEVVDILYLKCLQYGIEVYRKGNLPDGEMSEERIVILPKTITSETYWKKCFVEINFCVPNNNDGKAGLIRLAELERIVNKTMKGTGMWDETRYKYKIDTTGIEEDADLKCHYVNARVLFEILNV